ncbi:MAG: L,D-transpeptidase family protein, partial [Pseudomonadota bacterium]
MTIVRVKPEGSLQFEDRQLVHREVRCALGRGGVRSEKREGDGVTPAGDWPMLSIYHRPDRLDLPQTDLPVRAISEQDGWCDDPGHTDYNRLVKLPFSASHERLWREDRLYDGLIVLGYNTDPPVPGLGSAIFLHIAHPDYETTEGCVALAPADFCD